MFITGILSVMSKGDPAVTGMQYAFLCPELTSRRGESCPLRFCVWRAPGAEPHSPWRQVIWGLAFFVMVRERPLC